ncbi:uroplakin-3b-like isoform X2 [Scleropages formosus]|uniref:Uroplakin 3b n=1 Tax=Scleropages formosus TaxID=113540 RepID=A0A8C9WK22_SCLFO|nr:uroplakin-3b-like isoform X2 [Scleropages formosus]
MAPHTPHTVSCVIFIVSVCIAASQRVNNFDADKTKASILSLSPYPTAFTGSNPKNYYLTKVGPLSNYPCVVPPGVMFFRAGADGNCSTPNCNGALPTGSTVRFKYLLFNSATQALLMETNWSGEVILYSLSNPATIDDSMKRRSGGMIVITSILSVFLALLLLLLIGLSIYACRYTPEKEPLPSLGSLRVKKYDTHNVKQPQLYVNQGYVDETKRYASSEVLPSQLKISEDLGDSVKLKRYQNYDPPSSEDKNTEKQTEQQTPQDKVYKV